MKKIRGFAAPYSSLAGENPTSTPERALALNCRPAPRTPTSQYLSLDERMQIEMGIWGRNVVHPRSPNFFRFERDKQLEEKSSSGCDTRVPQVRK